MRFKERISCESLNIDIFSCTSLSMRTSAEPFKSSYAAVLNHSDRPT